MLREELAKELLMDYEKLTVYLKGKYGSAKYDYFCNESCKTKNKKVTRTNEGLQCHHIDEDKYGNLSSPILAKHHPFDCQKKDRLVYCNLIEHCLLHYKICALKQTYPMERSVDINDFFVSGGTFNTSEIINDLFIKNGSSLSYQQNYYEAICDNYDDYIWMIKLFLKNVENNYCGVGEEERCHECLENKLIEFSLGAKGVFYKSIYNDIVAEMSKTVSEEDAAILAEWKKYSESIITASLVYVDGSDEPLDTSFNNDKKIVVGEQLYDKRYGLGTITSVTPGRRDVFFTINFDSKGEIHMSRNTFRDSNMIGANRNEERELFEIPVFQEGDRVDSVSFGIGIVKAVTPLNNDQIITVDFEKVGEKDLLRKVSGLRKA